MGYLKNMKLSIRKCNDCGDTIDLLENKFYVKPQSFFIIFLSYFGIRFDNKYLCKTCERDFKIKQI
jgi:DNA-directed RNA polymerase subunit RPC12/RpoP